MERRKLVQSLAALPFLSIRSGINAIEIKPTKTYMAFVNTNMIDIVALASIPFPESFGNIEMELIPVKVQSHQSIEDAIRIYEVNENG